MFSIEKCTVPTYTLLNKYATNGAYADCYSTEVPGQVTFPEFINTFYTSWLFKVERLILKLIVSRPSTDLQARQLADGRIETFAAWHVENRNENEILLCDLIGRTRSWLMVIPVKVMHDPYTRLYFGSAVVPVLNSKTGTPSLGFTFQMLLGFHRIYSVLLLAAAKTSLNRQLNERSPTLG